MNAKYPFSPINVGVKFLNVLA